MFAHRLRRDEDYVDRAGWQQRAAADATVIALAGAEALPVDSPARALQAHLARQLGQPASATGLSPRARLAVLVGAAGLCWLPIGLAIVMLSR